MVTASRPSLSSVVRLACAGALAGICLTGCRGEHARGSDTDSAFADLRAVHLTTRPFAPRLTGGFAHAPVATPTRGPADVVEVDLRLAATRLEKRLTQDRSPAALTDFAAGALMTGHTADAIAALTEASGRDPGNARVQSDLAAAYLVRASNAKSQPSEDQVRALDAAATAVSRQPSLAEAWFNRALAMEGILPRPAVDEAWRDFLRMEDATAWAIEARDRIRQPHMSPPADVQTVAVDAIATVVRANTQRAREAVLEDLGPAWAQAVIEHRTPEADAYATRIVAVADALVAETRDGFTQRIASRIRHPDNQLPMARAFLEYKNARRDYTAERLTDAEHGFARLYALPAGAGTFGCWRAMQIATIAVDRRQSGREMALLAEPEKLARQSGDRAAHARVLWLRGFVEHQSNQIDAAREHYKQAASTFAAIRERENELTVYTVMADSLRLRGERRESWEYALRVLAGAPEMTNPRRRYLAFFNAALFASNEGWTRAALTLQDAAITEARLAPSPGFAIEGLTTKAKFLFALGQPRAAEDALGAAEHALAGFGTDEYAAASIEATRGEAYATTRPEVAELHLTQALAFFAHAEPAQAARLHLIRGRVRLARNDTSGAEADIAEGILDVDRRRKATGATNIRGSYLDDTADLFAEMASIQIRTRHNPDRAFDAVEMGRARVLLDANRAPLLSIEEVQRRLPQGVALIEFTTIGKSIARWTITKAEKTFMELPTPAANVAEQAQEFRAELQNGSLDSIRRVASKLYASTLAPNETAFAGAHTLVIVPDGALAVVPFGALVSERGRYVVEDHALSIMPSAAAFVAALDRTDRRTNGSRALLISDPAFDSATFSTLAPLPGARAEVDAIADNYKTPQLLSGASATATAFLQGLPKSDVVHFAGHAVENRDNPALSVLVFAPDRNAHHTGALRAHEIAALRLNQTRLVVLAACDTANGPVTRGEGVHSLARPFLEAGVPNVIATLWKVDDAVASQLFLRFHQYFSRSGDPAAALRSAQLDMIAGKDPQLASPRAWSAAVSIGATGTTRHSPHVH